jgi:membrane-anchored protein YejM (alkaline phosphatase superfamily)
MGKLLRFVFWFGLLNSFFFQLIGSRYLYYLLQSNTLFKTSTSSYESITGKLYVLLFTFSTFFGHFTLLACLAALIILPFVLFRNKWLVWIVAILVSSLSAALLCIDSIVFYQFRFHLNWVILSLPFLNKIPITSFFALSMIEIAFGISLFFLIILLETLIAYFSWKRLIKKSLYNGVIILGLASVCLVFSFSSLQRTLQKGKNIFAHQASYFPLYHLIAKKISGAEFIFTVFSETHFSQPHLPSVSLRYPLQQLSCMPAKKPYNILIIGIDSWRFDSITSQMMPNVTDFSRHAWYFTDHWSGGNATQPGIFSLFYSLPGIYWQSMIDQKKPPVFFAELDKQQYQNSIFFSSGALPFSRNVFLNLSEKYKHDAQGETAPDRDRRVTQELIKFIKKRDSNRPFFGFVFYASAHDYCGEQNIPAVFATDGMCNRFLQNSAAEKNARSRYWNAVHFIDQEIAILLNALREEKLDKETIILITGDHGEELNDNQSFYWGHAGNYTSYQVRTPLIVAWPKKAPHVFQHRTSHYDIMPTLVKRLLNCRNNIIDYSIGTDLLNLTPRPYILASSYINMGIIEKDRNTTLYSSGDISISDNKANEIPDAKPNLVILKQAIADMYLYNKW